MRIYKNKSFNREVESLDKLNHKNIVRILDRGYDEKYKAFLLYLNISRDKILKMHLRTSVDMSMLKNWS